MIKGVLDSFAWQVTHYLNCHCTASDPSFFSSHLFNMKTQILNTVLQRNAILTLPCLQQIFYQLHSVGKLHWWLAVTLGPAQTPRSHFMCPADELQTHSRNLLIPWVHDPYFILLDLNSLSVTAALKVIQLSCTLQRQCRLIFYPSKCHLQRYVFAPEELEQNTFLNNLLLLLPVLLSFSVLSPTTISVYTSHFKILPPQPHPRRGPTVWGVSVPPACPRLREEGLLPAPSNRPRHRAQLSPSARLGGTSGKRAQERAKRSPAARKKARETALRTARPEKEERRRRQRRRRGGHFPAARGEEPRCSREPSFHSVTAGSFLRAPCAFCLSCYTCSPQVVVANLINIHTNFEASCILKP